MLKRILVVDDEENNLILLKHLLRKEKYHPFCVRSGPEALELLKREKIDLVLLDWMMPEMDGLEVCKKIKSNPDTQLIPVIILSARTSSDDIKVGLDVGADDYSTKPILRTELLARVRAALRTGELQEKLNEQLEGVANIQRKLLPSSLPFFRDFKVSAIYKPCDLSGGDYYDVFPVNHHKTAFVVADVSHHGAPAMVAMCLTRSFLKLLASKEPSPDKALVLVNNALFDQLPTNQYVTMFYSVYDHQKQELTFAAAGHPPPFHYKARENKITTLKLKPGFPLKLIARENLFPTSTIGIEKGDALLFYTDGYHEAMNEGGEQLGLARMESIVAQGIDNNDPLAYLADELNKFIGQAPVEDDITLLFVQF